MLRQGTVCWAGARAHVLHRMQRCSMAAHAAANDDEIVVKFLGSLSHDCWR